MPRAKPAIRERPQPLSSDEFTHMVRKGLKRLQKAHDLCQRSATMENVHRMRRAIRHMRSLLDVCRQWEKSHRWRELHVRNRQLLHALGPLRDLQVRVEGLRLLQVRHPGLAPLLRRAEKEEREERIAVNELMAETDMAEVVALRRRMRRTRSKAPPRPALMRVIAQGSDELRTRWKTMRTKDPRSIHRARVALRRHTHLLASMAPYLGKAVLAPLPALNRMEERMGRAHDMQLLLDWTTSVMMKIPPADRPAVVSFLDGSLHLLGRRIAAFLRAHPGPGI